MAPLHWIASIDMIYSLGGDLYDRPGHELAAEAAEAIRPELAATREYFDRDGCYPSPSAVADGRALRVTVHLDGGRKGPHHYLAWVIGHVEDPLAGLNGGEYRDNDWLNVETFSATMKGSA